MIPPVRIFRIIVSILIIVSFFLSWFRILVFASMNSISGYEMAEAFIRNIGKADFNFEYFMLMLSMIALVLIPLTAILNLVQASRNKPVNKERFLPFIMVLIFVILMTMGIIYQSKQDVLKSLTEVFGFLSFGFYLTLTGSVLLLLSFNKKISYR